MYCNHYSAWDVCSSAVFNLKESVVYCVMLPKLLRCNTGIFFKYFREITLVFKTDGNGDVHDRIVACGE